MNRYTYRIPIVGYCLVEVEAETEEEADVLAKEEMSIDLDVHEWSYDDDPKLIRTQKVPA